MTQLELMVAPQARRRDPETSHSAARQAAGLQAAHHACIVDALRLGPAGADQLACRVGLTGH
jgi:hypothetical protein